jgi:hypothetical protein
MSAHEVGGPLTNEEMLGKCIERESSLRHQVIALSNALKELLEQVDSLDDYTLTRDDEPYRAQAAWDYVLQHAQNVLEEYRARA